MQQKGGAVRSVNNSMMELRNICNHPFLVGFLPTMPSLALKRGSHHGTSQAFDAYCIKIQSMQSF